MTTFPGHEHDWTKFSGHERDWWLDDNPGKTIADFERVFATSARYGHNPSWSEAKAATRELTDFWVWQILIEATAEGYFIRLGAGNFKRTAKKPPPLPPGLESILHKPRQPEPWD